MVKIEWNWDNSMISFKLMSFQSSFKWCVIRFTHKHHNSDTLLGQERMYTFFSQPDRLSLSSCHKSGSSSLTGYTDGNSAGVQGSKIGPSTKFELEFAWGMKVWRFWLSESKNVVRKARGEWSTFSHHSKNLKVAVRKKEERKNFKP